MIPFDEIPKRGCDAANANQQLNQSTAQDCRIQANPLIIPTPRTEGRSGWGWGMFGNGVKCNARGLALYPLLLFMNMCVRIMRDLPSAVRVGPYVAKRNTVTSICTQLMRFGRFNSYYQATLEGRFQGICGVRYPGLNWVKFMTPHQNAPKKSFPFCHNGIPDSSLEKVELAGLNYGGG
ncbi:hypothetical protein J6590_021158 [Homalodisca vitripennis]|nr:hypothetical protein J6590_021158 [Homalodisca vitripennis]